MGAYNVGSVFGLVAGILALLYGYIPLPGRWHVHGVWVRVAGLGFVLGFTLPFIIGDPVSMFRNEYVIRAIGFSIGILASLIAAVRSFKDFR